MQKAKATKRRINQRKAANTTWFELGMQRMRKAKAKKPQKTASKSQEAKKPKSQEAEKPRSQEAKKPKAKTKTKQNTEKIIPLHTLMGTPDSTRVD